MCAVRGNQQATKQKEHKNKQCPKQNGGQDKIQKEDANELDRKT